MRAEGESELDSPPRDEGLRCLTCGYNLTGLAGPRCPECGDAFDREALRGILGRPPQPVPGWDDGRNRAIGFARVCLMTWLRPGRFGKRFPVPHSRSAAFLFRTLAMAVGLVVYAGGYTLFGGEVEVLLVSLPGIIVGVVACERILIVAALWAEPRGRPTPSLNPDASASWSGLIGYFRSHFLVSALGSWLIHDRYGKDAFVGTAIFVAGLWWVGLGLAFSGASRLTGGRVGFLLCLPVATAFGIGLGLVVSSIILLLAIPALW